MLWSEKGDRHRRQTENSRENQPVTEPVPIFGAAKEFALSKEFHQQTWDDRLDAEWREILRLAVREDLRDAGDWTTRALVPEEAIGRAEVVTRRSGVIAGLPGAETALEYFDARLRWQPETEDGRTVEPGNRIARIDGPAGSLLTAERTVLNLLGRLSGIASLTRRYVEAVRGTAARIFDTRKTTPGWRRLEKYAVRCGGGWNHRTGLFDAVLIKDNHLAFCAGGDLGFPSSSDAGSAFTPAEAVRRVRQFIQVHVPQSGRVQMIVEVEIDTLDQLDELLDASPDIVLLDNMSPAQLHEVVARRDGRNRAVQLEASGGVTLETVRDIAQTGVDRISVGALTHSAACLDLAFDWLDS